MVLLKVTVLVPWLKVAPLFVQLPLRICEYAPAEKVVPLPRITSPPIVMAAPAVAVAVPARVKFPLMVLTEVRVLAPDPESVRFT